MNNVNFHANHDMQIIRIAITVALVIILFEVAPEKSVWSIPVKQADEHIIAIPTSGGFSLLLKQKQYHKALTKEHRRFWKKILIVDDDTDVTITFKAMIEDSNESNTAHSNKRIEVYTSNDPVVALSEFKQKKSK
jgi:hypothetical protein